MWRRGLHYLYPTVGIFAPFLLLLPVLGSMPVGAKMWGRPWPAEETAGWIRQEHSNWHGGQHSALGALWTWCGNFRKASPRR